MSKIEEILQSKLKPKEKITRLAEEIKKDKLMKLSGVLNLLRPATKDI